MFYIPIYHKRSGTTEKIAITPFNVKTLCPVCNCQFGVDLAEIMTGSDADNLMTTRVLCDDCAKKTLERLGADTTDETGENILVKFNETNPENPKE
jgi:hypothetical protein